MSAPQGQVPPLKTWWVVWFALLTSPFITTLLIGSMNLKIGPLPIPWHIALIPFLFGNVIRWVAIPRATNGMWAFVFFIMALGAFEGTAVLGAILFPEQKSELFALAVLGIAQCVPTFAKRFYTEK